MYIFCGGTSGMLREVWLCLSKGGASRSCGQNETRRSSLYCVRALRQAIRALFAFDGMKMAGQEANTTITIIDSAERQFFERRRSPSRSANGLQLWP